MSSALKLAAFVMLCTATVAPAHAADDQKPHHGESGIPLFEQMRLHGRFDVNYERVGYSGNPFDGADALRNYHHFLFLTRDGANDPISFNLEIIEQRWYEIAYRYTPEGKPWRVRVKAGRILVPFGPEPLFHHTYGGRAGFDQQLLPAVWAQHGASVNVQYSFGFVDVANDLYAVQGYALAKADDILDLQSSFSANDDIRFGVGDRLYASYGPVTAYYSMYFNALGFGRHLFMQAFDVSVARLRGVPILERMTLDIGVVRADVSGGASRGYGGANADYYHFADYLQLRYYPVDFLYVQLRTGIKTIGNRRGVYIDDTDLTVQDKTSHNIGIVARYHGLSCGLYHFWNLERRDEIKDDLFRLAVVYEF